VRKRLACPDSLFWDLKKIGYEKGVKVSDVIIEAYQDYIKKNEHLLNQKTTLKNLPTDGEVLLAQHLSNRRTNSVQYPPTIPTKDRIDRT